MRLSAITTSRRGAPAAPWLCLLLALGLVGCSDFLQTEPKGQLTTEGFFQTADQAVAATNATYSILRQWEVHVFAWIGQTDIASDDATKGSIPGDAGFLGDLDDLNFDPNNLGAFRTTWIGYYQGVYRANIALQGIPGVDMDEELKARLIAENKFLRAYFYFFLVRAHGGVPLITQPLLPGEFEQPRATAEQVYALIEQDLEDAIADLPASYGAADMGRATSGAAHAMLAQVHLYQEEYADVLEHAEEAINSGYSLFPDYETLFTPSGENSSEAVFEVQAAVNPGSGCQPWQGCSNTQYAEVQGVRGTPNLGWGFNTPSFELEAAYEPGDPRLQATILYPWEMLPDGTGRVVHLNTQMPNPRFNQKVFQSPENPGGNFNAGTNIRRIRFADVLLMAAEASLQSGGGAAATYLNMVRERARGGQTVTLGFTFEELAPSIHEDVLGLTGSRVFARYVNPNSAAFTAGLRGLESARDDAADPPIHVDNLDIIDQVDGVPITTPADYLAEMSTKGDGQDVVLDVVRVTQDAGGVVSTQALTITITAEELLPDIAAPTLEDIWQERRVELAMEQQRFFDIRRQDAVMPGRAAQLFAAHGKTWSDHLMLNPIPATEIQLAGLQQNPGY